MFLEVPINYTGKMGAFYDPNERKINFNLAKVKTAIPPYETVFHEIGHLIDHASQNYMTRTSTYERLYDTVKQEADEYIKAVHKQMKIENPNAIIPKSFAYAKVSKELRALGYEAGGDVSDMFSGATRNRAYGTANHDTAYWKKGYDRVGKEAFAEMFSASICNPKSVDQIKKYFPKSYAKFEEIIEKIAKRGK